jgi:hypothetical protein
MEAALGIADSSELRPVGNVRGEMLAEIDMCENVDGMGDAGRKALGHAIVEDARNIDRLPGVGRLRGSPFRGLPGDSR